MQVTLKIHNVNKSRSVEQNLFWYDPVLRKVITFKGTRLEFTYEPKTKRSTPHAVVDNVKYRSNDWQNILNWVNKNKLETVEINPGQEITVEIDEDDWDKLERELTKQHITYEEISNE